MSVRHVVVAGAVLGLVAMVQRSVMRRQGQKSGLAYVSDEKFLIAARSVNAFEGTSARLALGTSFNEQVTRFSQRLLNDEGRLTDAFLHCLDQGLWLPRFVQLHQAWIDDLAKSPPEDFDAAFVDISTTVYQGALSVFEAYSRDDATGPAKDYAAKHIVRLQTHLSDLRKIDLSQDIDKTLEPVTEDTAI